MSKVLAATCVSQVVTSGELPLPGVTILSQGVGESSGIAILDEGDSYYLANVTPDIKTTIERLIDVLTQVKSALDKSASAMTTLDGKPIGTLAPAPAATADIASITAATLEIEVIKGQLNTLKGAML